MTDIQLVLATGNKGKVAEMQGSLEEFGFSVQSQNEFKIGEAVEDGLSFVENALIKARYACRHTGLPSIADDSGLEVDALKGAPGIYSSRYSGEQATDETNYQKLLSELDGVPNRRARFQCVMVLMLHDQDPTPLICSGTWEGQIAQSAKGDNGFGYDPVFFVPEINKHAAELSKLEKKQFSHRGQALQKLKSSIRLKFPHL
jgi:XTP/dITP diphosphohydrolase